MDVALVGFIGDTTGSFLNAYWILPVAAVITALLGMALKEGQQEQVG